MLKQLLTLLIVIPALAFADYQFGSCLVRNPNYAYRIFNPTPLLNTLCNYPVNSSCIPRTHKYTVDDNGTVIERPYYAADQTTYRPLVGGVVGRPAYGSYYNPDKTNDLDYYFTHISNTVDMVAAVRRFDACKRGNCDDVNPLYACPNNGQVNNCIGGTQVGYRTNPVKCDCSFVVNDTQCDRNQCYNTSHPDWLSVATVPYCKMNGVPSSACMNSCAYFNSTTLTCGGNSEYCSLYSCVNTPQCTCEQRQLDIYRVWTLPNGTKFKVNATFPLTYAECQRDDGITTNRRLLSIDQQIFVSYKLGVLNVNSLYVNIESHLVLHKGSWSTMLVYSGGMQNYPLPNEALVTSGDLKVDVYLNATEVDSYTFYIVGQTLCVLHDCFLCTESFQNWSCLTPLYKTALIVVLILLFVLTLIALPVAVYCMYVLLWLLVLPFRCCFSIVRGFSKSKFAQDTKGLGTKIKSVKNYFYTPDPADGAKLMMVFLAFGIMSHAPTAFASCESGIFSVGNFSNCYTSGSNYTCATMYAISSASIPNVGSSLCFTLTDSSSNPVAQGVITYTSLINTVSLTHLYDTVAYGGFAESSYVCGDDNPCIGGPAACPATFSNDPTALGQITDTNLQVYPGQQFCRFTNGGWGQGCGVPGTNGCVYSGYALVANSTTSPTSASVYAIGQTTSVPTVTVTITDTAGGVTTFSTSITTSAVTSGNYSIQLIGSLASVSPNFQNQKVIYVYDNGQAYLGSASEVNQPAAGNIGDVQGNSYVAMRAGGENAYIYDANIVQKATSAVQYDSYSFVPSALSKVLAYPQFPTVVAGESFTFDSTTTTLINNAEASAAILVSFSTVTPVTISRTVSLVCPVFNILNATGCYSCSAGFSVTIEIQSTCAAGAVSVLLSNYSSDYLSQQLDTTLLNIPQTPAMSTTNIYGHTSAINQNLCFTVIANGGNQTSCIRFTAVQTNLTTSNKPVPSPPYHGINGTDPTSGFIDFWQNIGAFFQHIFTNVATWWEKLIFAVFVVVTVVIFIAILPYLIKLVKWAFRSYKTSYDRMKMKARKEKIDDLPSKYSDTPAVKAFVAANSPSANAYTASLRSRFNI